MVLVVLFLLLVFAPLWLALFYILAVLWQAANRK